MLNCTEINLNNILFLAIAGIVSFVLTRLMIMASYRFEIFDYPDERKMHKTPMPYLGGVAVFLSFWVVLGVLSLFCDWYSMAGPHFLPAMFLSSLLIFILGLLDDFVDVKYYVKIIFQITAAIILILFGFKFERMYIPFYRSFELGIWAYPATVLWVVVIGNSINFIDGMDGLATVISVSICLGLIIISAFLNLSFLMIVALVLAGSLVGFFIYNRPPAKIFLGDTGALFLGHIFAIAAVVCPIKSFTAVSMFVPLVAVSLPLLEVITTIIRRIFGRQKIYKADNRHIFHYLQSFKFSQKTVLSILTTISLIFNAFIPALFWFDRKQVFSIFVVFLMLLVAIFFIFKLNRGTGKL